jgi:hypothetical protein
VVSPDSASSTVPLAASTLKCASSSTTSSVASACTAVLSSLLMVDFFTKHQTHTLSLSLYHSDTRMRKIKYQKIYLHRHTHTQDGSTKFWCQNTHSRLSASESSSKNSENPYSPQLNHVITHAHQSTFSPFFFCHVCVVVRLSLCLYFCGYLFVSLVFFCVFFFFFFFEYISWVYFSLFFLLGQTC